MADTMKAVQLTEFGGPEVLQIAELPVPQPGDGELLVKIDGAGINFADVYMRQGARGGDLPMVLGMEAVGTVAAVGANVSGTGEGDQVVFRGNTTGSYAEFATVADKNTYKVPDGVSADVALALHLQGMTAHYLSHEVFTLGEGTSCLIHAGAGGVGHILIQIAKARGARVFATVGDAAKAEIAKGYGADEVILYDDVDFKDVVMDKTGGKGVDVVYDAVGKATIVNSIGCVHLQGVVAWYGDASGPPDPIDGRLLGPKCVYLTRVGLGPFVPNQAAVQRRCDDLFELVTAGKLNANVAPVRPLAEAAQAHADLQSRGTVGKLILRP